MRWEFRPPGGYNSPALAASVSSPPREAAATLPLTLPIVDAMDEPLTRRASEHPVTTVVEFTATEIDRRVPLPDNEVRRRDLRQAVESDHPEFAPPKRTASVRLPQRETAVPLESVASNPAAGSSGARSDAPPQVLQRVDIYPPEALVAGLEGTVRLNVRVNAQGIVTAAALRASSGHSVLDQAALAAIYRWRFETLDGGPGAVAEFVQPIRFRIDRD